MIASIIFAAALASPLQVTDDPFKPYVSASIVAEIAPATSFGHYCHDRGEYRVTAVRDRKTAHVDFVLSVMVLGLRSPGSIELVEFLGALPLKKISQDDGPVDCFESGCHNGADVMYAMPAPTVEALDSAASTPLRITTSMGDACTIAGSVSGEDMKALTNWATKPQASR